MALPKVQRLTLTHSKWKTYRLIVLFLAFKIRSTYRWLPTLPFACLKPTFKNFKTQQKLQIFMPIKILRLSCKSCILKNDLCWRQENCKSESVCNDQKHFSSVISSQPLKWKFLKTVNMYLFCWMNHSLRFIQIQDGFRQALSLQAF